LLLRAAGQGKKILGRQILWYDGGRIGNAHLRWAFSEAALLYLRGNTEAEKYYNRLISRHGKSKALIPKVRDQTAGYCRLLYAQT
jgi:transposase